MMPKNARKEGGYNQGEETVIIGKVTGREVEWGKGGRGSGLADETSGDPISW